MNIIHGFSGHSDVDYPIASLLIGISSDELDLLLLRSSRFKERSLHPKILNLSLFATIISYLDLHLMD